MSNRRRQILSGDNDNNIMTKPSLSAFSIMWILLPDSSPLYAHAWISPTPTPIIASSTSRRVVGRRTRLRTTSTVFASNNALPKTATTAMDAGISWDDDNEINEEELLLEGMTVSELKERLRSIGQKVTGSKMELIQRLLSSTQHQQTQQQPSRTSADINAVNESFNSITTNDMPIHHSLSHLPPPLIDALIRYTTSSAINSAADNAVKPSSLPLPSNLTPKLLPIQQQSYPLISQGRDTVLFSPTGSGKSLAFILPLAARLLGWKNDGSLQFKKDAQRQHYMKRGRTNGNDSLLEQKREIDIASPLILIVEPSRELARQVGKIWTKFHPSSMIGGGSSGSSSKRQVVTVYGGVPMTRHAALLGSKTEIVIGTPGRIKELIREKYLSTKDLRSIVLDEADTLLNFGDNPEVEWLLDGMANDYQLVLASATINKRVEKFVTEVMELEVGEEGYVVVNGNNELDAGAVDAEEISIDGIDVDTESTVEGNLERTKAATVRHWSMPASATSRVTLTSDLILTMTPRRCIVFAPTKAEVESVAQELKERLSTTNDISIHVLHGDMVQQARSRTVSSFRDELAGKTRILVATDVASRGLDLPAVDLVLQYCVPRKMGKDATYDSELYIHRTGRAGRFGSARTADAILLYDRSQGEVTTLNKLAEEMKQLHGINILPRQLPSSSEVMEAAYDRVVRICERLEHVHDDGQSQSLLQYFADKLHDDLSQSRNGSSGSTERESLLILRLATAMASLSGLKEVVPARSLLTGDSRDRTVRVRNDSINPLSPSEVTKIVKSFGSGKVGRISVCNDGSVVFDLDAKKAELLIESVSNNATVDSDGWRFDLPESLSTMT